MKAKIVHRNTSIDVKKDIRKYRTQLQNQIKQIEKQIKEKKREMARQKMENTMYKEKVLKVQVDTQQRLA
jgi:hypothetical protein